MKREKGLRILSWVIRALIVVAFVVPLIFKPGGGGTGAADDAVVQRYEAQMDIDEAGDLTLVEHLLVDLPAGKHGIFRIFDTADPRRSNVEHPVVVESIERDGESEHYEVVGTTRGTYTVRIGRAEVILTPGLHEYTIRSTTTGVFEPGDDDTTLWWWDIVGSGWQMRFESVSITAQLPAEPTKAECVQGKDTACKVTMDGDRMLYETTGLGPFEPVTVRLTFPADRLAVPVVPTRSIVGLVAGIVLGVLAAAGGVVLVMRTREKPVGLPVLFEPPQGIYPALGVKIRDEIDSPYALQATLFDLAERGLLSLAGDDQGWLITVVGDPATTVMTAAEAGVLGKLGLHYKGATFNLTKSVTAGKAISEASSGLNSQVLVDSRSYLDRSPVGCTGSLLGWATIIVFGYLVIRVLGGNPVNWVLYIPFAAAAFALADLLFDQAAWTVRNAAGRDMWSRVGGFARFLTTDSAETRFDFARREDLYPRYLPWALVFGSADAWAQRYRDNGVEPPVVPWLIWTGSSRNYSMTSMSQSFNSAISSAASAYSASQSSSGGGFSGGSGGGGGGGGSW